MRLVFFIRRQAPPEDLPSAPPSGSSEKWENEEVNGEKMWKAQTSKDVENGLGRKLHVVVFFFCSFKMINEQI